MDMCRPLVLVVAAIAVMAVVIPLPLLVGAQPPLRPPPPPVSGPPGPVPDASVPVPALPVPAPFPPEPPASPARPASPQMSLTSSSRWGPCRDFPALTCTLSPTTGSSVGGRITLTPTPAQDGRWVCATRLDGIVTGLKPGAVHAWHVHTWGDISATDGSATGGHLNPMDAPHSLPEQAEAAAAAAAAASSDEGRESGGDIDTAPDTGSNSDDDDDNNIDGRLAGVRFGRKGDASAYRHLGDLGNLPPADVDGIAIVTGRMDDVLSTRAAVGRGVIIHAAPDTGAQPTGNAGARLAQCVLGVAATTEDGDGAAGGGAGGGGGGGEGEKPIIALFEALFGSLLALFK